jgi:hypothetical protein
VLRPSSSSQPAEKIVVQYGDLPFSARCSPLPQTGVAGRAVPLKVLPVLYSRSHKQQLEDQVGSVLRKLDCTAREAEQDLYRGCAKRIAPSALRKVPGRTEKEYVIPIEPPEPQLSGIDLLNTTHARAARAKSWWQ